MEKEREKCPVVKLFYYEESIFFQKIKSWYLKITIFFQKNLFPSLQEISFH